MEVGVKFNMDNYGMGEVRTNDERRNSERPFERRGNCHIDKSDALFYVQSTKIDFSYPGINGLRTIGWSLFTYI